MIPGSVALTIFLLAAGLIFPVRWLLRVWLEDRVLSTPLALSALSAHLVLYTICVFSLSWLAAIYCILLLLYIGVSPYLNERHGRQAHRRMAEEDIAKYEHLLQRDPNHAAAQAALAAAYLTCERFDDAIAAYERAMALDPINSRNEIPQLRRARELQAAYEERQRRRRGGNNIPNKKPPASREA